MRICKKCGENKKMSGYRQHKEKSGKIRFDTVCRECMKKKDARRREKEFGVSPEQINDRMRFLLITTRAWG